MKKMVETLVSQHNELRALLSELEQQASHLDDGSALMSLHTSFLKKLEEHLSLENGFFYPKILDGMKQKNTSSFQIDRTKLFISKMKDIEVTVLQFFDTYKTKEIIAERKDEYLRDLKGVISTLSMRLEIEEDGIYMVWDFFGEKE